MGSSRCRILGCRIDHVRGLMGSGVSTIQLRERTCKGFASSKYSVLLGNELGTSTTAMDAQKLRHSPDHVGDHKARNGDSSSGCEECTWSCWKRTSYMVPATTQSTVLYALNSLNPSIRLGHFHHSEPSPSKKKVCNLGSWFRDNNRDLS